MAARIVSFVALIAIVSLARLLPHPPNFSPMLALALFAGAKAPNRWLAVISPVSALWITDLIIGTHYMMMITGLALLLATGIGIMVHQSARDLTFWKRVGSWAGAGFGASALFFFITNYFVWQTSGMYNRTWDGLVTCFQMAPIYEAYRLFWGMPISAPLKSTLMLQINTFAIFIRIFIIPKENKIAPSRNAGRGYFIFDYSTIFKE
jgi:hypothetical protein